MNEKDSFKNFLSNPYTVWAIVATAILFFSVYLFYESSENLIKGANESYLKGELATKASDREAYFNEALNKFLEIEKKFHPSHGNGKLYFAIGNSFFQLGEYPYAVLYYYKSLYLSPLDKNIKENLKVALAKLNIQEQETSSVWRAVFFFHYSASIPLKLQLFFLLFAAFIAAYSCYIWFPLTFFKIIAIVALTFATAIFLSLAYTYLFQYSEAIIVKSTNLYKGSGEQFTTVTEKPIPAGSKVWVLKSNLDGDFIKIESNEGKIGFVASNSLRLIF